MDGQTFPSLTQLPTYQAGQLRAYLHAQGLHQTFAGREYAARQHPKVQPFRPVQLTDLPRRLFTRIQRLTRFQSDGVVHSVTSLTSNAVSHGHPFSHITSQNTLVRDNPLIQSTMLQSPLREKRLPGV